MVHQKNSELKLIVGECLHDIVKVNNIVKSKTIEKNEMKKVNPSGNLKYP